MHKNQMLRKLLVYFGGFLLIIWGISHLIPTNNIVRGFGNITIDNILIIKMEWINEGLTLIFVGLLNIAVTMAGDSKRKVANIVYILTFIMLVAMSVLSLFTGFRIAFLPFKLCPLIFMACGLLILQDIFYKRNTGN